MRVAWSSSEGEIIAGIDEMVADGQTSISDGFQAAGQLFADSRPNATKVLLLLSDGQQTVDAAPGKTPSETSTDAAALLKANGVTVFAWGFGKEVNLTTLQQIATDPSKALLTPDLSELNNYLAGLEATICNESPPPPPPPSPSSPSPPPPQQRQVECGRPGDCSDTAGLRDPNELHEVRACATQPITHACALYVFAQRAPLPSPWPGAVLLQRQALYSLGIH